MALRDLAQMPTPVTVPSSYGRQQYRARPSPAPRPHRPSIRCGRSTVEQRVVRPSRGAGGGGADTAQGGDTGRGGGGEAGGNAAGAPTDAAWTGSAGAGSAVGLLERPEPPTDRP